MLFLRVRVDKDVIQVYNATDVKKIREGRVNIALKYCRSISKAKRHHCVFEMAVSGPEGRFLFVPFFNSDAVVRITQV